MATDGRIVAQSKQLISRSLNLNNNVAMEQKFAHGRGHGHGHGDASLVSESSLWREKHGLKDSSFRLHADYF